MLCALHEVFRTAIGTRSVEGFKRESRENIEGIILQDTAELCDRGWKCKGFIHAVAGADFGRKLGTFSNPLLTRGCEARRK